MAAPKGRSLEVQEKKELVEKEEATVPARYYVPHTDIYETDDELTVVMEMPGVQKDKITVELENDVLSVEGQIDFSKYAEMRPLYTEYNIGHFTRKFSVSSRINQANISAEIEDGILTLRLPKAEEVKPRTIKING